MTNDPSETEKDYEMPYGDKKVFISAICSLLEIRAEKYSNWLDLPLKLMVRWYPQLDDTGKDTYGKWEIFREEFKYTPDAVEIEKQIRDEFEDRLGSDDSKEATKAKSEMVGRLKDELHYEHNPPVKVVFDKLTPLYGQIKEDLQNELKQENDLTHGKDKASLLKERLENEVRSKLETNYEVIIVSELEQTHLDSPQGTMCDIKGDGKLRNMNKGYKQSGTYIDRLSFLGVQEKDLQKPSDEWWLAERA